MIRKSYFKFAALLSMCITAACSDDDPGKGGGGKSEVKVPENAVDLSAAGTANCYIVKPGDVYKRQAEKVVVLHEAEVPPFTIEETSDGGDDLRMKYRYLDLRRPPLQRNMILRHKMAQEIRRFLDSEGFLEIETPYLVNSTPEGARDFVVPSRMSPNQFYALPQSPQTLKPVSYTHLDVYKRQP